MLTIKNSLLTTLFLSLHFTSLAIPQEELDQSEQDEQQVSMMDVEAMADGISKILFKRCALKSDEEGELEFFSNRRSASEMQPILQRVGIISQEKCTLTDVESFRGFLYRTSDVGNLPNIGDPEAYVEDQLVYMVGELSAECKVALESIKCSE